MSYSPSLQARRTVEFSSICSDTAVENWKHQRAQNNKVRRVRARETHLLCVLPPHLSAGQCGFSSLQQRLDQIASWQLLVAPGSHCDAQQLLFISWDTRAALFQLRREEQCHSFIARFNLLQAALAAVSALLHRLSIDSHRWQLF